MMKKPFLFIGIIAWLVVSKASAEVKLPALFSDNAVLQQGIPVPVWGTASDGEKVTVAFAGQTETTTAKDGRWMLKLKPLEANATPQIMTITGSNTIEIKNLLVGEVWLGSGQSNMDTRVSIYTKDDPVLATLAATTYPKLRLLDKAHKGWVEATPVNNDKFSALLFTFGTRLQQELNVPVGIILGALGHTSSCEWLTEEMLRGDTACQTQAKEFAQTYDFDAEMKKYESVLVKWKEAAEKAKQENVVRSGRVPKPPVRAGESDLSIGKLYEAHIRPYVPYAIRGVLWDQGEHGTALKGVDQFNVMGALIKGWRKDWGQDFPFLYVQKPSGGGTAWNLDDPTTIKASKFSPLPAQKPGNPDGLYRELHIKIQQHPKTAMVTSSDLGDGLHPVNKSGYGARAARVALCFVYGKMFEIRGPLYASHEVEGSKIRVKFTHVGQGLAVRHSEKLQGFMIAGSDKRFYWADAIIEGDCVILTSSAVEQPVAVRYAWSRNISWANLFNKDGLPAQTFRTDDWK